MTSTPQLNHKLSTNWLKKGSDMDEILTLEEAAAFLKITPRQVIRYKVPHFELGQKTKLFKRDNILEWLETKRKEA